MYYLIVFLPLLGAIIAGVIALAGARQRHPGAVGPVDAFHHGHGHGHHHEAHPTAADFAAHDDHGHGDHGHDDHAHGPAEPAAARAPAAEIEPPPPRPGRRGPRPAPARLRSSPPGC